MIPVDSTIFGDPCPGTNKYVEVHYTCKAQKHISNSGHLATTNKPLPPWLLALDATPSSVSTTTTERTTKSTSSTERSISETSSSVPLASEGVKTVPNPIYNKSSDTIDKQLKEVTKSDIGGIIVEEHIVSDDPYNSYGDSDDEDEPEDDSDRDDFPEQIHILEEIIDHCPPRTERNLFWNWTQAGSEAIQICPQGSSGFARWSCGENGEWEPSTSPNL